MRLIDFLRDYREAVEEEKEKAERRQNKPPAIKRYRPKRLR
jgi:hypothetical protein